MQPIIVFLSLYLSSPQNYITLDALVLNQTQNYQMGFQVYTTTPPAGSHLVAMKLLNKLMQKCCLRSSWEAYASKAAFTPEETILKYFNLYGLFFFKF